MCQIITSTSVYIVAKSPGSVHGPRIFQEFPVPFLLSSISQARSQRKGQGARPPAPLGVKKKLQSFTLRNCASWMLGPLRPLRPKILATPLISDVLVLGDSLRSIASPYDPFRYPISFVDSFCRKYLFAKASPFFGPNTRQLALYFSPDPLRLNSLSMLFHPLHALGLLSRPSFTLFSGLEVVLMITPLKSSLKRLKTIILLVEN